MFINLAFDKRNMLESELNRFKVLPPPSTTRIATEGELENMYGDSYREDETPETRVHGIQGKLPERGSCNVREYIGKDQRARLRVEPLMSEICGLDYKLNTRKIETKGFFGISSEEFQEIIKEQYGDYPEITGEEREEETVKEIGEEDY